MAKYRLSLKCRVTRSLGAARNHKLIILPPEYLSTRWHHLAPLACIVNHMRPHAQHLSYIFGHQVVPLALVKYLATKWCHLQIFALGGTSCIDCKFWHQVAPLALVATFATAGDISSKSDHQVAPHALVAGDANCIATLTRIAEMI